MVVINAISNIHFNVFLRKWSNVPFLLMVYYSILCVLRMMKIDPWCCQGLALTPTRYIVIDLSNVMLKCNVQCSWQPVLSDQTSYQSTIQKLQSIYSTAKIFYNWFNIQRFIRLYKTINFIDDIIYFFI